MTVLSRLVNRGLTPAQIFGTDFVGQFGNTQSGVAVTQDTARNLLAVWACQRLLTNSIATMPAAVLKKVGDKRIPQSEPTWMRHPTTNPNDTFVDHISDVVMSLLGEGNTFTRGIPQVNPLTEYLYVANPAKVQIKGTVYHFTGVDEYGAEDVMHISLLRRPGELRGISPIDNAINSIGLGLAAQEFGNRFFGNGATVKGIIQVPQGTPLTEEAKVRLRDSFETKHQGLQNSHAVGILMGGAEFKELTVPPAQSQLLELRKFQIEDIARMYGIPPHKIGSQEPGAVAYASIEQREIDYVTAGVMPLVVKIEKAYQRLLPPDQYLKFNLSSLLRSDIRSRYEAHQIALQNKFMTIDEVRAFEDMEPFGGKEGGLLETPNNNPPDRNVTNDGLAAQEPSND